MIYKVNKILSKMNTIQKQIREGTRPYFKTTFVVIFITLACLSGCKDEDKKQGDEPDIGIDGGKLEIEGMSYPLDSATWAYYSMSERGTLRLLSADNAINLVLSDIPSAEVPTGKFTAELRTNFAYKGIIGGASSSSLVIAKLGSRYEITLTGSKLGSGEFKATYKGSIKKVN